MGNTYQPGQILSFTAAADLVKHRFVDADGNYCAANEKAFGVTDANTDSGDEGPAVVSGTALVYSGGAITKGAAVTSDENGKAVAVANVSVTIPDDTTPVTSDNSNPTLTVAGGVLPQPINGYALESASGADELIKILVK